MYSLPKEKIIDGLIAILLLLLVFLLAGKIQVGEQATGFYIVRPTSWYVTADEANIEFTSFYPTTLTCRLTSPYGQSTFTLDPRSTVLIRLSGTFTPGSYVSISIELNCGVISEKGTVTAFVFT